MPTCSSAVLEATPPKSASTPNLPPSGPSHEADFGPAFQGLSGESLLTQLQAVYQRPLLDLLLEAQQLHRHHHPANTVQLATLANIKSGKCPEDCSYCPQSSRYQTGVEAWDLPPVTEIQQQVRAAKANGSNRFCMGAAWRTPPSEAKFQQVIELVKAVRAEGLEPCVTLGMINAEQAERLKTAGLVAYNHNIDTSPNYYPEVISTRTIEDRLNTLEAVGQAGLQVCCGGILGMGETLTHRLEMLQTLMSLPYPPESVPINTLVAVEGTPLAEQPPVEALELIRLVATTRLALPKAKIRLSAGRAQLSDEAQALCFMAGANSMFAGDTLLTTPNPGESRDAQLFSKLGLNAEGLETNQVALSKAI